MRVDKSSEEQDNHPLTSYALDRCSLQFGEVPVSNTHRTLLYLSGMFRLPSLLWLVIFLDVCFVHNFTQLY